MHQSARRFGALGNLMINQNAMTLEDLVKDLMRPMLKSWLDDNLPALVERLVRAEIEQVSARPKGLIRPEWAYPGAERKVQPRFRPLTTDVSSAF